MNNNDPKKLVRAFDVDMSSQAITIRLREVSELHQLGLSLSKAKPCAAPGSLFPEKLSSAPRFSESTADLTANTDAKEM